MKKNLFNEKRNVVITISIITILFSLIGYSFSYFSAVVTENNKKQSILKANILGLKFTGEKEINCSNIIPGDICSKTFTVENTSNRPVTFNIYMENILNEFSEDFVYDLTEDDNNILSNVKAPDTKNGKTYIKESITINNGEKKTYTLSMTLKYIENKNQNVDQGAIFNTTIGIDALKEDGTIANGSKCIPATKLHSDKCVSGSQCVNFGYSVGDYVYYGKLVNESDKELEAGMAFVCDVNGDNYYSESDELFYYMHDDNGISSLVYSKNVFNGKETSRYRQYDYAKYNESGSSYDVGPTGLISHLPTNETWSNVSLTNTLVNILDETGTSKKSDFSYDGYAARLITIDDVEKACDKKITNYNLTIDNNCLYLLQNTRFTDNNANLKYYFLGNAFSPTPTYSWLVDNGSVRVESLNTYGAIRPVIEVNTNDISLTRTRKEIKPDSSGDYDLYEYIAANVYDRSMALDFDLNSSIENENGIYKFDDKENIYFYRGRVDNNIVYGGFCWKILRTTETKGIKLIYNGTLSPQGQCISTGIDTSIGESDYSKDYVQMGTEFSTMNDNALVGYMYGAIPSTSYKSGMENLHDSLVKQKIDDWFRENIDNRGNTRYLEDTIFCNDRNIVKPDENKIAENGFSNGPYTELGYGDNPVFFRAAYNNWYYSKHLSVDLNCINTHGDVPSNNDAFSVSTANGGNGKLTYPVGLLTLEETILAGNNAYHAAYTSKIEKSDRDYDDNYLASSYDTWTMTPIIGRNMGVILSTGIENEHNYNLIASLSRYNSDTRIRPVVSLKPGTKINAHGTGSKANPFRVVEN